MAKTTMATQIRKAFGALSANDKQAWSEDGRGGVRAWTQRDRGIDEGVAFLEKAGFEVDALRSGGAYKWWKLDGSYVELKDLEDGTYFLSCYGWLFDKDECKKRGF